MVFPFLTIITYIIHIAICGKNFYNGEKKWGGSMKWEWIGAAALALLISGCAGTPAAVSVSRGASAAVKAHRPIGLQSGQLYEEAQDAYQKGNWEGALSLCDRALRADSQNYKALSLKGLITALYVSPEAGIDWVGKALSVNPDYVQGWYEMAMAQKVAGHYDESIRYFQKVLARDPENTWSLYGIASNYADMRDRDQALTYLKKAVAIDGAAVRPAAASQDHFQWLHADPEFQEIVKQEG